MTAVQIRDTDDVMLLSQEGTTDSGSETSGPDFITIAISIVAAVIGVGIIIALAIMVRLLFYLFLFYSADVFGLAYRVHVYLVEGIVVSTW